MPRTGKQADELFASTKPRTPSAEERAPDVSGKRRVGAPNKMRAPTSAATVVLFHTQIVQLDEITNRVRARSGKVMKRADLIRGILSAVLSAGLDLSAATSEEEVGAIVTARFSALKAK